MNENKVHERNYLLWIGTGIFICLILLTGISLLDLRKDIKQTTSGGDLTDVTASPQIAAFCPFCGTKSLPQCFSCGRIMQWNTLQGMYSCPGCQRLGHAFCPYCTNRMNPQGTVQQEPILAAGCATCPSRNFCQPAAFVPNTSQNTFLPCPGHCPGCPLGTPQSQTQQIPNNPYGSTGQVAFQCPGACPGCPLGTPTQQAPNNPGQAAWSYGGGAGRPNYIICPNCGYTMQHQLPAYSVPCPKCGTRMVRGQ